MGENLKSFTLIDCVKQLSDCQFQCEAGPLENNVAFRWLDAAAKVCPEFLPGQGVWFEVEAEAAGVKLSAWKFFYIVGCSMSSDTERRLFTYALSNDPPAPWHYGTTQFTGVRADKLRLENPTPGRDDSRALTQGGQ